MIVGMGLADCKKYSVKHGALHSRSFSSMEVVLPYTLERNEVKPL